LRHIFLFAKATTTIQATTTQARTATTTTTVKAIPLRLFLMKFDFNTISTLLFADQQLSNSHFLCFFEHWREENKVCVCVCLCVCEREREREIVKAVVTEAISLVSFSQSKFHQTFVFPPK